MVNSSMKTLRRLSELGYYRMLCDMIENTVCHSGEASKQVHEYKLKLQKAEQEITNLDGTVSGSLFTFKVSHQHPFATKTLT